MGYRQVCSAPIERWWLDGSGEGTGGGDGSPWLESHLVGSRFDTIDLDLARWAGLRAAHLPDAYAELKRVANAAALDALPEVLHRLDAVPANQRWPLIFREMLAGNWFDMGTVELVEAWRAAGDVRQGHQRVPERPWRWMTSRSCGSGGARRLSGGDPA